MASISTYFFSTTAVTRPAIFSPRLATDRYRSCSLVPKRKVLPLLFHLLKRHCGGDRTSQNCFTIFDSLITGGRRPMATSLFQPVKRISTRDARIAREPRCDGTGGLQNFSRDMTPRLNVFVCFTLLTITFHQYRGSI